MMKVSVKLERFSIAFTTIDLANPDVDTKYWYKTLRGWLFQDNVER